MSYEDENESKTNLRYKELLKYNEENIDEEEEMLSDLKRKYK